MKLRLPSRYEDIDTTYRGRLLPNPELLAPIDNGNSGSGKSCATNEISTHLPSTHIFSLDKEEIEEKEKLLSCIELENIKSHGKLLIGIIDQYEENVSGKEKIPTQFVEHLSLLD